MEAESRKMALTFAKEKPKDVFIFLLESAMGYWCNVGYAVADDEIVDSDLLLLPDDHNRPDVYHQGDQKEVVNDKLPSISKFWKSFHIPLFLL